MPVLFVVLGLVLVHTVPGTDSVDTKRSLSLRNSTIDDDDIKLFYAEFDSGSKNPIFQVRWICGTVMLNPSLCLFVRRE